MAGSRWGCQLGHNYHGLGTKRFHVTWWWWVQGRRGGPRLLELPADTMAPQANLASGRQASETSADTALHPCFPGPGHSSPREWVFPILACVPVSYCQSQDDPKHTYGKKLLLQATLVASPNHRPQKCTPISLPKPPWTTLAAQAGPMEVPAEEGWGEANCIVSWGLRKGSWGRDNTADWGVGNGPCTVLETDSRFRGTENQLASSLHSPTTTIPGLLIPGPGPQPPGQQQEGCQGLWSSIKGREKGRSVRAECPCYETVWGRGTEGKSKRSSSFTGEGAKAPTAAPGREGR